MMEKSLSYYVVLLFVVASAGFWFETGSANGADGPVARLSAKTTAETGFPSHFQLNPLDGVSREALTETISRPLFSPGRRPTIKKRVVTARPKVAEPPKVNKRAKPKNPFELVGIIGVTGQRIALLRHTQNSVYVNGKKGDRLKGWEIVSVGRAEVMIEIDGARVRMTVFE